MPKYINRRMRISFESDTHLDKKYLILQYKVHLFFGIYIWENACAINEDPDLTSKQLEMRLLGEYLKNKKEKLKKRRSRIQLSKIYA